MFVVHDQRVDADLVDAVGYNRVRGLPFRSAELAEAITAMAGS